MTNDNINRRPADRSATERPERWVRVPDVRDRAAQAAHACWFSVPWERFNAAGHGKWRDVVDAVVAVVAEEIARPLQARIAELEEEVARRKRSGEALNTELEAIGAKADEAWRALNPYMARVELLTAALTELVQLYDGTHAMFTTIPRSIACGPITKVFEDAHDRARAALAAGEQQELSDDIMKDNE